MDVAGRNDPRVGFLPKSKFETMKGLFTKILIVEFCTAVRAEQSRTQHNPNINPILLTVSR